MDVGVEGVGFQLPHRHFHPLSGHGGQRVEFMYNNTVAEDPENKMYVRLSVRKLSSYGTFYNTATPFSCSGRKTKKRICSRANGAN